MLEVVLEEGLNEMSRGEKFWGFVHLSISILRHDTYSYNLPQAVKWLSK